jgi:hypothetical protein
MVLREQAPTQSAAAFDLRKPFNGRISLPFIRTTTDRAETSSEKGGAKSLRDAKACPLTITTTIKAQSCRR